MKKMFKSLSVYLRPKTSHKTKLRFSDIEQPATERKMRFISFLSISLVCFALSCSAFALPLYTSAGLKAEAGKVMEKETPKEYMEDFSTEGKQNKGQLINTIFLSEKRIAELKAAAAGRFKETLGTEIPGELIFECNTFEYEGVIAQLKWADEKDQSIEKDAVAFYADFKMQDASSPAVLSAISIINGYDEGNLAGLKELGADFIKKEYDVTIPDEYFTRTRVTANFSDETHDIRVEFSWAEDRITDLSTGNPAYAFGIVFDGVDLSKGTGRVTAIENTIKLFDIVGKDGREFTESEEKDMLEAAKGILLVKGIGVGNLISSRQIGDNMWFTFDSAAENNTPRTVVDVYISKDLELLGYVY